MGRVCRREWWWWGGGGAGEEIQIRSLELLTGIGELGVPRQRAVAMALADYGPIEGHRVSMGAGLDSLCTAEGGAENRAIASKFGRHNSPRRAPTRGAPTRLSSLGVLPWEGHPQGVPLPIVFSRRFALGRAPTRGAPTDCLLSAFGPGKDAHKGCPYRLSSLGVWPWEGHSQGVPFYRLSSLGVLPCVGHPTDCLLSAFCPA